MVTSVLLPVTGLPLPAADAIQAPPAPARVEAFENALARHVATPADEVVQVAQVSPAAIQPAPGPQPTTDPGAEERARRGLGLDGVPDDLPPVAPTTSGDMILNGIQQLRSVFDVREAHIAELMSSQTVDANKLMAMQMEVANFGLLVDISSKLTGKTTSALDTLMKGQ